MCYYIAIEDLVANAMIAEMSKNGNDQKTFFTYSELERFGAYVIKILEEKKEKAVLVLSRERTSHMLSDYADFFEEREVNGNKGIGLKDGVNCLQLIDDFRGYLPLDVLMAFIEASDNYDFTKIA